MAKSINSKLGKKLETAVKKHRSTPVENKGQVELPHGIEGGIAKLVDCKFGIYKSGKMEGEFYFLARGIVVSPKLHEGMPVEGLSTMIMEPVCDTPTYSRKTIDDHVKWVLNELKKLGADTAEISAEELETLVGVLKDSQPYFRFRTWRGEATEAFPNPRTQHQWQGHIPNYSPEVVDDVQEEDDEEAPEAFETESDPTPAPAKKTQQGGTQSTTEPDLSLVMELAELADADDEDAAEQLTELADQLGMSDEEKEEFDTWTEMAEEMLNRGNTQEEEETPEKPEIQKGDIVSYVPPGWDEPEEMEVKTVNVKRQLVTLESLADGEVYKGVAIAALEG